MEPIIIALILQLTLITETSPLPFTADSPNKAPSSAQYTYPPVYQNIPLPENPEGFRPSAEETERFVTEAVKTRIAKMVRSIHG